MSEASPIPPPRPDDDEDVHWALSTSSALWARGDTGEALKWLRRAAETASDQNRDQRSLELFKAAADATTFLGAVAGSAAPPAAGKSAPPFGAPARPPATPAPPPIGSAPPPMRGSQTPPPPRASATPPPPRGGTSPPPLAATPRPPGARSAPPTAAVGRGLLKQTLPSEGIEAARDAVLGGGASGASGAASQPMAPPPRSSAGGGPPPTAARRSDRKATLDDRFQFPDDEVTMERDVAALRRPQPVDPSQLARVTDEAAASAMAATSPHIPPPAPSPAPIATPLPGAARPRATPAQMPAPRTAAGIAAASGPSSVRGSSPTVPTPAPTPVQSGPLHATHSRTIVSAGTSRHAGPQTAAARSMSRQITRRIETVMQLDDLDEKTSVLTGEESELDFDGSETGETPEDATGEQSSAAEDHAPPAEGTPDPGADPSRTEEPLYAPSIRPQSPDAIPHSEEVAPPRAMAAARPAQWTAMRVALRRDGGGVRIEALPVTAAVPPGAVPAVLVAHDAVTAEALARLLEPR